MLAEARKLSNLLRCLWVDEAVAVPQFLVGPEVLGTAAPIYLHGPFFNLVPEPNCTMSIEAIVGLLLPSASNTYRYL